MVETAFVTTLSGHNPTLLFDGKCLFDRLDYYDDDAVQNMIHAYNTSECGYDNGDCL